MDKSHKDPKEIDVNRPRHVHYLHNAWKRHQDAVYWVDINLAIEQGLTFCQTRSNAIILHETLPAYCIPKVVRMKTGEVFYEKVYMSPRPPSKISLKHEWKRELSSQHAQRAETRQLSRSFQSDQPTLNPIRERSGRPDITHDVIGVQDERKTSPSLEIYVDSFCEEPSSSERTGRLVTGKPVNWTSVIQVRSSEDRKDFNVEQAVRSVIDHDVSHESIMVNEANMDFRIPGLPHSVVKHAQSTSVRKLIQKIENHPDRYALQQRTTKSII